MGMIMVLGPGVGFTQEAYNDVTEPNEACPGEDGRYCDNGDGTVTDSRTGLIWLKNASCDELGPNLDGSATFEAALHYTNALFDGHCGLRDGSRPGQWRLPSPSEWREMMDRRYHNPAIANASGNGKWRMGDLFEDVRSDGYWTDQEVKGDEQYAWSAGLFGGTIAAAAKNIQEYIWPVREP